MPAAPDRLLLWGSAVLSRATQEPEVVLRALRRAGPLAAVADRLAPRLSDGSAGAPALAAARAAWHAGRWEEAVALAPAASRLRRRLAAELAAARWRPDTTPASPASGGGRRVLHVVTNSLPHTRSGYTQRTQAVLRVQRAQADVEVAAATPLGYPATVGRLPGPALDVVDGIPYHRLLPRTLPFDAEARLRRWLDALERLARDTGADLLHAHSHWPNALAALHVGRRLGLPVVYEVRGVLEETWAQRTGPGARDSDRYALFRAQEEFAVQHADAALTIGAGMRDDLAARTGRGDIRLVPNAVDDDLLARGADEAARRADRDATRRALGIGPDDYVVGSVSSLVDYEGFDVLLAAAARLAGSGTAVTVLLVGAGDDAPRLARLGRELPAGARLVLPGRVPKEQVPAHLAALDVFVVPRTDTPVCRLVTPLKPAEAMAAGLPLVLSDLPALREFADDGVEGLVVAPEDPAALADALARLTDPATRRRLGAHARERVGRDRTWTANAAVYRQVYEEVWAHGVRR
ncbi:glycosyltransferase [Aquipuribacter nitratireducens]|uniref:D-inositol 3-phosphate glycosyltransferase n=1 Tax=Aquipuribacter nitratireducens TaxID=650104 RepID=A0ABW0GI16_9MICO